MKRKPDIAKPRSGEQILPFPWPFRYIEVLFRIFTIVEPPVTATSHRDIPVTSWFDYWLALNL